MDVPTLKEVGETNDGGSLKPEGRAEEHHVQRARHEQCKGQTNLHPVANGFENHLHRLNDGKTRAKSPGVYFRLERVGIQVSFTSRFLFRNAKRRPEAANSLPYEVTDGWCENVSKQE